MKRIILVYACLLTVIVTQSLPSQSIFPKSYVCYRTAGPIKVDGELNEISWGRTEWTDLFVEIEGDKPWPRFQTRVKMLWDDSYFYVAAELQEPDVWATLTQRDTIIFLDNDFEVFIDPDGDTHLYYELEINALNTVWDLLMIKPYRDGGPSVNAWDIHGLKSSVTVQGTINHPGDTDSGWTVELAFPWNVLKECAFKDAPPKRGDQWRINFSRVEWKTSVEYGIYKIARDAKTGMRLPEENWVWSPQGVINMHYPEMWGFVQFSNNEVGKGNEAFLRHADENAKWVLRQVYYSQKKYFVQHGRYASNTDELELNNERADGYVRPPTIGCTQSRFEAVVESVDRKERWHITEDGRTWKQ